MWQIIGYVIHWLKVSSAWSHTQSPANPAAYSVVLLKVETDCWKNMTFSHKLGPFLYVNLMFLRTDSSTLKTDLLESFPDIMFAVLTFRQLEMENDWSRHLHLLPDWFLSVMTCPLIGQTSMMGLGNQPFASYLHHDMYAQWTLMVTGNVFWGVILWTEIISENIP